VGHIKAWRYICLLERVAGRSFTSFLFLVLKFEMEPERTVAQRRFTDGISNKQNK
jgi:hypothetical protein